MSRTLRQIALLTGVLVTLVAVGSPFVSAQFGGNGNGFGGGGGGNNRGGRNNRNSSSGIKIDAQGVVALAIARDATGALDQKHRELAAKQALFPDVNQPSKMRYVSLVELEKIVARFLKEDKSIPDEAFFLAGLQRIDHVFLLPETKELIIAGPAEGFAPDNVGRMLGVKSGRPTLRLDDLVVALRTVARTQEIGCSIDPVPERLAELQRFISQGGPAAAQVIEARFRMMDDILGLQKVTVDGVPADSHFGIALVEADYRMKRISIGLENPGVKGLRSHLSMLGANGNSMQRWWFVPLYDSISRSDSGLAYQFDGQRAQLLSEEELSDAQGNRIAAPTTRLSTVAFSKLFTEKFPELADKSPIFGELQNLIDWAVFAALVHKDNLAGKVGWQMATFLDEQVMSIPKSNAPKMIPSSMNYKHQGKVIIGLVAGGVIIRPDQVLTKAEVPASEGLRLTSLWQDATTAKRDEIHHWWWDLAPEGK